jgi:hypothetical protein
MPVTLNLLSSRLQAAVSARNGVPSSEQYEQCVRDAVADFSRRAPMQKVITINVTSGTASYALPADFVKMIRFASALNTQAGVLNTSAGLIPVSGAFKERVMMQGGSLVLSPTPTYTMERELWYMAGLVLNSSNAYADMTDTVAAIVMKKAQALALTLQANRATQEAWSYTIGDESVTKTQLAAQIREQAQALDGEYLAAVEAYIGLANSRGDVAGTF